MVYLLVSPISLLTYAALHAVTVRLGWVRYGLRGLIKMSIAALGIYTTLMYLAGRTYPWDGTSLFSAPLILTSITIFMLISIIYIMVFSMAEYESPSLATMKLLNSGPNKRMSAAAIRTRLSNEILIQSRLEDLVFSGHIRFVQGNYELLPKGALVARVFTVYRLLLMRGMGG